MALSRAEREAVFRAEHGVSSGTYYEMRRKGEARGISPSTFDALARDGSYSQAKHVAQTAAEDVNHARYEAAGNLGLISSDLSFADFFEMDWSDFDPPDYEWWYH